MSGIEILGDDNFLRRNLEGIFGGRNGIYTGIEEEKQVWQRGQ